jgi:hypothetical protein
MARKLVEQKERTNGSAGGNFGVAAVALRQPRQQRVFAPHLHAVPAEHAPEEISQAVNSIRDTARRSGRLERADVGDAPSGAAARKIHDRDVLQRHVAQ